MAHVATASPRIDPARLRELRQIAGLSCEGLGRAIGVTGSYISAIERGQRPTVHPATFNRILAALGVSDRAALLLSFEQVVA